MGFFESVFRKEKAKPSKEVDIDLDSKIETMCLEIKQRSIAMAKGIQEHYPSINTDCLAMEILSYNYALMSYGKISSLSYDYYSLVGERDDVITVTGHFFTEYIKEFGENIKTKESFLAFSQYWSNFQIADRLFQYRIRYILANNDCASIAWRGFKDLPNDEKAIAVSRILMEAMQKQ